MPRKKLVLYFLYVSRLATSSQDRQARTGTEPIIDVEHNDASPIANHHT